MRLLFLCNTLYQLVSACCIREMFPNDEAELILTDHSSGSKGIAEKFEINSHIFDKVYYSETKHLYKQDAHKDWATLKKEICNLEEVLSILPLKCSYDSFFCANSEPFSLRIVNYVKLTNKSAQINWFEDGLSAYYFDKQYFQTGKEYLKSKILNFFGFYSVTANVNNYYVFNPDKMEWKPRARLCKIVAMSETLNQKLSKIFDVDNCVDKYEEKYIFFEDGARDWTTDVDIEVVRMISEIVGKDNLFVRIHPRNSVNRFKELGFKTNEDTFTPWEIISGKLQLEDKVLLTIYSQCIITPETVYGKDYKAISLAKLDNSLAEIMKPQFDFINKHYLSKNENKYFVPNSKGELKQILKKLQN